MNAYPTKIILHTDDFEGAQSAARMATDLADGTGSELHVVYMGRVPDSPRGLRITERHLDRAVYEDMERQTLQKLWELARWVQDRRRNGGRGAPWARWRGRIGGGVG